MIRFSVGRRSPARTLSVITRSVFTRPLLFLALCLVATPAPAALYAHFRVTQMSGGCFVDDQEGIFLGDPERYFRMAIFDSSSSTVFNACASGCTSDNNGSTYDGQTSDYCSWSTGCGTWNFTDRHMSKIIPNQRGA